MNNKTIALFLLTMLSVYFFSQYLSGNDEASEINNTAVASTQYVCPMHSHIVSDHEKPCPICGMNLVKVHDDAPSQKASNHDVSTEEYPVVEISPTVAHNLGVRTAKVLRGDLKHTIDTIGKVTRVDQSARSRIVAPMYGKLVKMADKFAGDTVVKGEFLFSVGSDDLFELEKKYQEKFVSGEISDANTIMTTLTEMGIDAGQLAALQQGAEPVLVSKTFAEEDGYVFARRGKAGDAVTSSFTVFRLSGGYQVIEVAVEIFERQWAVVQEKQPASMQLRNYPGKTFEGEVYRVDDPVGYTTRALEARLKFKTDFKGITQSAFARVVIQGKTKRNILLVPRDAVIRTAKENRVVRLNENGQFQPVVVEIGEESDDSVEVIAGLNEGDNVIISGQFLIDSESNIMSDLRRMTVKSVPSQSASNSEPQNSSLNSQQ